MGGGFSATVLAVSTDISTTFDVFSTLVPRAFRLVFVSGSADSSDKHWSERTGYKAVYMHMTRLVCWLQVEQRVNLQHNIHTKCTQTLTCMHLTSMFSTTIHYMLYTCERDA